MKQTDYIKTITTLINDYREQLINLAYDLNLSSRMINEKPDINIIKTSVKNAQNDFNEILKIQNTLNLMAKFKDIK